MLCQREYFKSTRALTFRSERAKMSVSLNKIRFSQSDERVGWLTALGNILEHCPLLAGLFGDRT
jgi:hypothetical protein